MSSSASRSSSALSSAGRHSNQCKPHRCRLKTSLSGDDAVDDNNVDAATALSASSSTSSGRRDVSVTSSLARKSRAKSKSSSLSSSSSSAADRHLQVSTAYNLLYKQNVEKTAVL